MLMITIPETELYDESSCEFIKMKKQTIQLEHSLVSISKWESKWHKPFLNTSNKTPAEMMDYVRCMTIAPHIEPVAYKCLTRENWREITKYIADSMTATTFSNTNKAKSKKQAVTSELIYSWMVTLGIPFECQKWHINRLLTLIHICDIQNTPAKKMSKREIMAQNRALNSARRARTGSSG